MMRISPYREPRDSRLLSGGRETRVSRSTLSSEGRALHTFVGGLRDLASWSFLTNHALVLTVISQRPESTGLEIAQAVGITERATRKIIADLQDAGYIESERIGRRNRYRVNGYRPVGRFGERELTVGEFLVLFNGRRAEASLA
jgi:DNA-binding transcriptional ArsR family regulator